MDESRSHNEKLAVDRIQLHVDAVVAFLGPGTRADQVLAARLPCEGMVRSTGAVKLEHSYDLRAEQAAEYVLDILHSYWAGLGYLIVRDDRDDIAPDLVFQAPDGFVLTAGAGIHGNLHLSAASPCFPVPEG
ncbi:hypothetical protein [Longispora albida]|uniref:hypothetical protein n=1 Tax=Longispora albida TaxID=203523 RepID=UPI000361D8EE|nr:hypothetical protein [Longispora albida]